MAISARTEVFTIDELPELLNRLEHEPISAHEIERRRKVFAEVDRIRETMEPIPGDIKDWIRRERGE